MERLWVQSPNVIEPISDHRSLFFRQMSEDLTVYHFWVSFLGIFSIHEKDRSVGGGICCLRDFKERV